MFNLSVPSARHTSSIAYDDLGNPSLDVDLNPTVFDTEVHLQTPVGNTPPGGYFTTGTVQPGLIDMADSWQIAVKALISINAVSAHHVGVVGKLHVFLDDMFPNAFLGKPIFGGRS